MGINKDSQKAPNLRFKGFTDDWEQRNWSSTVNMSTNMVDPKDGRYDNLPHIGPGNIESFSGRILNNVHTVKEDNLISGKFHFKENDIIYGKINPQLAKYAYVNFEGLASADTYVLNSKKDLDQNFLFFELQTDRFYKYSVSVSMRTGMPKVNRDELNQYKYLLPNNISEQRLIGTLFKNIDKTITLHQRKLDQLNQLKEALLQQVFPGKSENVPKLRFAGFEGDWEERKLSALFIKGGSGGTPKSTNKDFYEGNIPFLGISDITKSNGFINNTEKHISVDGLNNSAAWVVPRGSISLAMYASVGKVAVLNIDVATSQAFYNMVFDDDDLRDFVYQCLIKANELSEWNKLISTGTQANLNADKVKNFMLYLPQNHAEIKLISAFLKQFDTTIAIQQRKLEQLQDMKQVLLQNMFI